MHIAALQKTTLIDFPGHVSAMVFTQGCNFTCPYCHNPNTQGQGEHRLSTGEVLDVLAQRRQHIQGVVISGGEPCLHKGLPEFCRSLKALGFAVKLDTNGSQPGMLGRLLREQLLDYVAMDLKSSPWLYPPAIAPQKHGLRLLQSMALIEESGLAHEYRITCVSPFIQKENFLDILENCNKTSPIFLQKARTDSVLDPLFFGEQGEALSHNAVLELNALAVGAGYRCQVR